MLCPHAKYAILVNIPPEVSMRPVNRVDQQAPPSNREAIVKSLVCVNQDSKIMMMDRGALLA